MCNTMGDELGSGHLSLISHLSCTRVRTASYTHGLGHGDRRAGRRAGWQAGSRLGLVGEPLLHGTHRGLGRGTDINRQGCLRVVHYGDLRDRQDIVETAASRNFQSNLAHSAVMTCWLCWRTATPTGPCPPLTAANARQTFAAATIAYTRPINERATSICLSALQGTSTSALLLRSRCSPAGRHRHFSQTKLTGGAVEASEERAGWEGESAKVEGGRRLEWRRRMGRLNRPPTC